MPKPYRDRRSRYDVSLSSFSAIARELLKVRRQVKHCKKGFREIFQMSPTERYVCIWNIWENRLFFILGKVFDHFQEKYFTPTFYFFRSVFLASTAYKDYA